LAYRVDGEAEACGEGLLRQAKPGAQRSHVLDLIGCDPAAGSEDFRRGEHWCGVVVLGCLAGDVLVARRVYPGPIDLGQVQLIAGMSYGSIGLTLVGLAQADDPSERVVVIAAPRVDRRRLRSDRGKRQRKGAPFARPCYSAAMLDNARIAEITREVGREKLSRRWVEDVMVEPATDSLGNDAVRLTIVIASAAVKRLKGDDVLGLLVELRKRLDAAGEERVPLLGNATRDELAANVDSEP
jgi:hypothetical protein